MNILWNLISMTLREWYAPFGHEQLVQSTDTPNERSATLYREDPRSKCTKKRKINSLTVETILLLVPLDLFGTQSLVRIDVEVIYHFFHSFTMGVLHGYCFVDASPVLSSQ